MLITPSNIQQILTWQDWVKAMQQLNKAVMVPIPIFDTFAQWVATFQLSNKNLNLPLYAAESFAEYDSNLKLQGY